KDLLTILYHFNYKYLNPPLDVQLESVNCTAISVRWRMPWRHVGTITGYKVNFTCGPTPSTVIGNLEVSAEYSVTVGAYGWAGQGRPSMPRSISTIPDDHCMLPVPPPEPRVTAVSDTEFELSWKPGTGEGSPPVLYFLVYYIRPEMDTEWTSVKVPTHTRSMVLRGMSPDTQYQFMMRAANMYGESHPSPVTGPIWTLRLKILPGQKNFTTKKKRSHSNIWLDLLYTEIIHSSSSCCFFLTLQGEFTKITFRTPLYLGGSPAVYWLARAAGTSRGFQGCVQSLAVNGRMIDMRPWPLGRALSGADVGECSDGVCTDVSCENGGVCYANRADGYICLCPLGYRGPLCQETFSLFLPHFNAALMPYLSAPWPRPAQYYLSFTEFEMTFLPEAFDGTLLYSEDLDSRDFLSVVMVEGHVEFRFDCGSGTIAAQSPVKLGVWYTVTVYREGLSGWLRVDNNTPVTGRSQVTVNDRVVRLTAASVKGVNVGNAVHPCADSLCANAGVCRPKHDDYECDCPLGYRGKHCQSADSGAVEIPQFTGRSYLMYDSKDILKRISGPRTHVQLRFRSSAQDGLLMWIGDTNMRHNSDYMFLALHGGTVVFSYNLGSGTNTLRVNGTFIDGRWHTVRAVRDGQMGKLSVGSSTTRVGKSPGRMRQLNTSGALYIGGIKEASFHIPYLRGLVGCMSHLTLSPDHHLRLIEDASDGKNINTCLN
uniref:EGF like, fibronectin type III and laminin G domains n=1 Tax=Astyanax mexicanus TaxID=7994 RepID=A0A8B9J9U3_ASTMX